MRPLIVLAIVLVLAATAVPPLASRLAERQAGAVEGERAGAERPRVARAGPARGREVAIRAERDGLFYVEAEINRRPVRLMVDTGASVVALRQSDAERVGLRPRPADFREPVATA